MTYDKKEDNEMCLSSAFKEACEKYIKIVIQQKGNFYQNPFEMSMSLQLKYVMVIVLLLIILYIVKKNHVRQKKLKE